MRDSRYRCEEDCKLYSKGFCNYFDSEFSSERGMHKNLEPTRPGDICTHCEIRKQTPLSQVDAERMEQEPKDTKFERIAKSIFKS